MRCTDMQIVFLASKQSFFKQAQIPTNREWRKEQSSLELTLVTMTFNPCPAVSSHLGQLPEFLLLLFLLLLGHLLLHLGSHLHCLSGL